MTTFTNTDFIGRIALHGDTDIRIGPNFFDTKERVRITQAEACDWIEGKKEIPIEILDAIAEGQVFYGGGPSAVGVPTLLDPDTAIVTRPGLYLHCCRSHPLYEDGVEGGEGEIVTIGPLNWVGGIWGSEIGIEFETPEDAARYFAKEIVGRKIDWPEDVTYETQYHFPIVDGLIDVGYPGLIGFSDWDVSYRRS